MSARFLASRLQGVKESVWSRYTEMFPKSFAAAARSRLVFANGLLQAGRNYDPFPLFVHASKGAYIQTIEGVSLVDLWLGHFVAVHGHGPGYITSAIREALEDHNFLQVGQPTELESDLAELLTAALGYDWFQSTLTGADATSSACRLARVRTKRRHLIKFAGGWHGVQPWSSVATKADASLNPRQEQLGAPESAAEDVIVVRYNDPDDLRKAFAANGHDVAAVLVEPVLGNCGMLPATRDFMLAVREYTSQYGACMIADEIVTGFRMMPGPLCAAYNVRPDILVLGKAISGGLPFACILADWEWAVGARRNGGASCMIDLGTFTAHPGVLRVILETSRELLGCRQTAYEELSHRMRWLQTGIRDLADEHSVPVAFPKCVPGLELPFPIATAALGIHEISEDGEGFWDRGPLRDVRELSRVALATEGVYAWQGLGALSTAHEEPDLGRVLEAYDYFLGQVAPFLEGGDHGG